MLRIETDRGSLPAKWTLETTTHKGARMLAIEFAGAMEAAEIVDAFAGASEIREIDEAGNVKTYEGYTLLSSMTYSYDRSAVRLTLERA